MCWFENWCSSAQVLVELKIFNQQSATLMLACTIHAFHSWGFGRQLRLRQFGNFHWVESTFYTKTKCSDYIQKVLSMTSCPKLCLKFVNKVLLGRWKRETVWLWLFQHQNDVDHRYPRSLQTRFSRQWRKGDFTVKNVMDRFQTEGLECEMLGKCDSYQDFAPDGFISQRYSNKTDGDTVNSNIRYTAIV